QRRNRLRILMVEQVGVAESEPCGRAGLAGMGVGVGGDSVVCGGRAHRGELLGHGPKLRRRDESLVETAAAGQLAGGQSAVMIAAALAEKTAAAGLLKAALARGEMAAMGGGCGVARGGVMRGRVVSRGRPAMRRGFAGRRC